MLLPFHQPLVERVRQMVVSLNIALKEVVVVVVVVDRDHLHFYHKNLLNHLHLTWSDTKAPQDRKKVIMESSFGRTVKNDIVW